MQRQARRHGQRRSRWLSDTRSVLATPPVYCQHGPDPNGVAAMPSTFLSLHYHVVFSTNRREPFLAAEWRPRLHEYLGGTVRGLGARSEMVGGMADHVHLLFELKATHTL